MNYDVIIVGAGPGGIFSAYELTRLRPELKVAVFEAGHPLKNRRCPIDGVRVKSCIACKSCSIMSGFGGAGAFSDGKYNITNDFGGTLYEYLGKAKALELMRYVDQINMAYGGEGTKLYSTAGTKFKKLCMQNDLHLLDASVRHLGTDINYVVLENLYAYLKEKVTFYFDTPVESVAAVDGGYQVTCKAGSFSCSQCVISVGRSGSKWMESVCRDMDIPTKSNRVDIGVRVELPAEIFSHLTDELYESKIVYRTEKYGDLVRTFCMNPKGAVVNENTNGIITVNGHSYEDQFCPAGGKALFRTLQGFQRLRRVHCPPQQYAGRRRHRPALRRPDPGSAVYPQAHCGILRHPHAGRDTRRLKSGAAQADSGRHHRDALRAG